MLWRRGELTRKGVLEDAVQQQVADMGSTANHPCPYHR